MYEHLAHQLQRFSPDDPYERCGFLFSKRYGTSISFREVPNSHPEPEAHFRITKLNAYEALSTFTLMRGHRGVMGALHTHPGRDMDGWLPSPEDVSQAARKPHLVHAIYHPYTRRLTWFSGQGVHDSFHLRARWLTRRF